MVPVVAALAKAGLSLLANAFLVKGKEWVEEKVGVKLDPQATSIPPEQVATLKQAEMEHEEELARIRFEENKLDVELEKAYLADRSDARKREVDIAVSANAPLLVKLIVPVLAIIVVVGSFILLAIGPSDSKPLAAGMGMLVLGYYFGSSNSEHRKDAAITKWADES